jgi:HEAT repeat protein
MSSSLRCARCHGDKPDIQNDADGSPLCLACREQVYVLAAVEEPSAEATRVRRHRRSAGVLDRDGSDRFRRKRKKRKRRRAAKRSRLIPALVGAAVLIVLVGVGLALILKRPRGETKPALEEMPVVNLNAPIQPPLVVLAQTNPEPPQLPSHPQAAEEVPPPALLALEAIELVPAPALEMPNPVAPQPGKLKRRRIMSEDALRNELGLAPEVGLTRANRQAIVDGYDTNATLGVIDFQPSVVLHVRPDLARLPVRVRQLDPAAAKTLGTLSRKLHAYVDNATPKDMDGQRVSPIMLRQILYEEKHGKRQEWLRPEAVPVLRQLLGHEQTPIRKLLVELLNEITGQRASELLAERAVFDLTADIRAAAVAALSSRPREQFRHVFFSALRYPWAPAADHAAEALVALDDRDVLPRLVTLLDQPDPSAPFAGARGTQFQRQLVGVSHSASCLMCHAPAVTMREPVIGVVPDVRRRQSGGWGGGRRSSGPLWVRADVTFFRQDFSESIPAGPAALPVRPTMRFDFLVRTRPLGSKEAKRLQEEYAGKSTYEQREAVLFALRELSGKDAGAQYEEWLKLYPTAELDTEVGGWVERLLKAPPGQRDRMLTQLRDAKGPAATQALAVAIPKLPVAERAKAREVLVKRLARMTADSLRDRLQDPDTEVRRAAAAACVPRNDPSLVADLIPLLHDQQSSVSAEALDSLKGLTGQDLGDSEEAWQAWLRTEGSK